MESLSPPAMGRGLESLHGLRIGSVPYLNARPLTDAISDHLVFDVPSELAARFRCGELDAALLPVYEAIDLGAATVADGVAIACDGEVYSVILATREPVGSLQSVALDPASRTSSHLLQCLFAEYFGKEVEWTDGPTDDRQARLIIGDPAIEFRRQHSRAGWEFIDLGAEWKRWTELPFVFACWVFRPGLENPETLAASLREVKRRGVLNVREIVGREPNPLFALRYFSDYVRFELNSDGKRAIDLFATLLRKYGLVGSAADAAIRYV